MESDSPSLDAYMAQARAEDAEAGVRKWKPLTSLQRRVAGVLVEKAKTTPDAYPLSVNAIVTGCNQKSNRSPQMSVTAEQVEETLAELRELGAVAEVQSSGRVERFRHYMKDWLGVDKFELAVVTELLLRGPQTIGELRGRAARMEPIADLTALRPIMDLLKQKELLVELTPPGRGQIVTHGLYPEAEMARVRDKHASGAPAVQRDAAAPPPPPAVRHDAGLADDIASLRAEIARLADRVAALEARQ